MKYQSATSGERVYRAGLPQGSVLSPAMFLLWVAPLAAVLQRSPLTTAFFYADDTAVLRSGNSIEMAQNRAQRAADSLTQWARSSKMQVAGQKKSRRWCCHSGPRTPSTASSRWRGRRSSLVIN